jgi:uncharacterized membrane protein
MGLKSRLYLAALLILLFGLSAGATIYFSAEEAPEIGAAYVVVDGKVIAIPPGSSRTYVRELRRFGGSASVLLDEFNRWFASLWQGKQLGVTIASLSTAIAAVLAGLARWRL